MKNEHGERMDRNGYAMSIVQDTDGECYQCGETWQVERHEIFGGPMRDKSKAQGLWVNLCPICHRTGEKAVHQCAEADRALKRIGQQAAMDRYGWSKEEWMQRFYKSYL